MPVPCTHRAFLTLVEAEMSMTLREALQPIDLVGQDRACIGTRLRCRHGIANGGPSATGWDGRPFLTGSNEGAEMINFHLEIGTSASMASRCTRDSTCLRPLTDSGCSCWCRGVGQLNSPKHV